MRISGGRCWGSGEAVVGRPLLGYDQPEPFEASLDGAQSPTVLRCDIRQRIPGLEGPAAAAAVSGTAYVPVGVAILCWHPPTIAALLCALATGVLSSAVPFLLDLLALRRVPAQFFGVFMSVNPVFAALAGLIVLGQSLGPADWLAITVIVAVNAVTASGPGRPAAAPTRPPAR